MGETLPYQLWRFNSRWEISNKGSKKLNLLPSEYFKKNFWCTTAGVCSDEPLRCAIDALGTDRVMFSVDYPFEKSEHAGLWIDNANLSVAEKSMVCYENAKSLLKL